MKNPVLALLLALFAVSTARAQFDYTPISIPTRDGRTLAADFYTSNPSAAKPVILIQTPYNKNLYRIGAKLPPQAGSALPLDTLNFNYVVVDWRGFFGSKDAAEPGYDRGLDGYDAVEWIAEQPWCNGRVGTWGPSALGAIQFSTARHQPPHLVCSVPLVKDFKTKYTDYFYGGEYRKAHVEALQKLGFLTTSVILNHGTNDLVWQVVEGESDYPEEIAVPMLVIGGWFDHYPDDVIRAFHDLKEQSDPSVREKHRFLFGPWTHSGISDAAQGQLTFQNAVGTAGDAALRFFHYYLLDEQNNWQNEPVVRYYQLGADEWRVTDDWFGLVEQTEPMYLYISADGGLGPATPLPGGVESETLTYNPKDPSPTVGGSFFDPFGDSPVGPWDQRELVESRNDVLIHTTEPLAEDLTVTGPIAVELFVSSDREDTDVAVRLCDVYPDGRSILLTQGIRRMRFRDGFRPQDTSLIVPGEVYPVTVELQNLAITFRKGHSIRLIISSSNYPHFDVNPNTAAPLYESPDSLVATNTIYLHPVYQSHLVLPVAGASGAETIQPDAAAPGFLSATPEPFRSGTTLEFMVPVAGHVLLEVYDLTGNRVAGLLDRRMEAGRHTVRFDAEHLPVGAYFCRLTAAGSRAVQVVRKGE